MNVVMDESIFNDMVKREILKYLPIEYTGAEVNIIPSNKNNGVVYDALTIKLPADNFAPLIPLNQPYEHYLANNNFQDTLKSIAEFIINCPNTRIASIDYSFLRDWNQVKDRVYCRLINRDMNKDFLQNHPHKDWNDLSIIYYVDFGELDDDSSQICKITNALFEDYKDFVDLEGLHKTAINNLQKIPYRYGNYFGMTVLQHQNNIYGGAVQVLNEMAMKDLAKFLGEDFYLLPSSIHEWIVVPDSYSLSPKDLAPIVQDVNADIVDATEVLSNSIYHCDHLTLAVDIAYDGDYDKDEPDEETER